MKRWAKTRKNDITNHLFVQKVLYFQKNVKASYKFIFLIKDELVEVSERVGIEINYVQEEIEIKIESLKIELDQMKVDLFKELDDYKKEFNE